MIDYFIITHNQLLVPNLQNTNIVDYQILLVGNETQYSTGKNTIICKNFVCSHTHFVS